MLKLPLIKNKKTVNPRDTSTPAVFQLETAMGSAIECFEDAGAVVVPRARFAPVKTTNDLFALRSDAFKVSFQPFFMGHCISWYSPRPRPRLPAPSILLGNIKYLGAYVRSHKA